MGKEIHVEKFEFSLKEDELQGILFKHFKIKTGNWSKVKISDVTWPMQVEYEELLERDWRVTVLGLEGTTATTPLSGPDEKDPET